LAPDALQTLAEIMHNRHAPAAARVAAAVAVLDRGFGRPGVGTSPAQGESQGSSPEDQTGRRQDLLNRLEAAIDLYRIRAEESEQRALAAEQVAAELRGR
jgi:hypothetical protein